MAKDKKKDHARTKAKKEPGKHKTAAAASAPVDAPEPAGSEPLAPKARVRPTRVAAPAAPAAPERKPAPASKAPQATRARVRPARVAAPDRKPAVAAVAPPAAKARVRPARVAAPEPAGAEHHAAKAHGRATQVDTSLPGTRQELMALHAAARARRNAAALNSPAFRAAVTDLERIEIRIAAVDRAADPPLG